MEESFFLNIYDLAFNAKSAEVFNEIAENITIILKAYACSIWINNYKVENTETRLGYYEDKNQDNISQIDYDLSYKT
ncbi:MAG: serine/threonine-protein phosphatase, partial [Clostridiales bacterium]|nr:serine/threonine-protein phosphatase [Clostridiales bacterium]